MLHAKNPNLDLPELEEALGLLSRDSADADDVLKRVVVVENLKENAARGRGRPKHFWGGQAGGRKHSVYFPVAPHALSL